MDFYEFYRNKSEYEKKKYIDKLLKYIGKRDIKAWYSVFSLYFSSIKIFKPLISMEIYHEFKPKTILDPTMGWGGRLLGACVLDIHKYIGIDLNKNLKIPYEKMTKHLKELGTKTIIDLRFQDALTVDYSKLDYDMVFTSPPYYNIETYTGMKRMKKEEWNENFYKPLFEKTYRHMKKGYFILNIPIEVYEDVCIGLLGKANRLIPLNIQKRGQSGKTKINYKEYIYVWKK